MKLREVIATPKTIEKLNRWKRDIQNLTAGSYRPYLTVRAVNKVGRRHKLMCDIQNRQVHLLSDGELRMYKKLIHTRGVIRVLEQYALNLDETLDIAVAANLIHPRNWETNEAHVMTTDFVVQQRSKASPSEIMTVAYSFKYAGQIYEFDEEEEVLLELFDEDGFNMEEHERKNARTWQKFAIEHEYWRKRGVEYRIVTEYHATKEESWNIDFCRLGGKRTYSLDQVTRFVHSFCSVWLKHFTKPLIYLWELTAKELSCSPDDVKQVFKYSVLHHYLPLVHSSCLQKYRPVELAI